MRPSRRAAAVLAPVVVVLLSAPATRAATSAPAISAAPARAVVDSGALNGDAEAFGVRVEYDIPIPAGSGSVPHVVGDVGRHSGSDVAHGIAGAPSQLDAAVGGQYVDPGGQNGGQPERNLPQTECYYPGRLVDTVFRFPTNTQGETESLPATSVGTAQCAVGPYLEMHASDSGIGTAGTPSAGLGQVVHSGAATADALARTLHGVFVSDASAHVSDLAILGAIKDGSVSVSSHSETTGQPGGGRSSGKVTFSGLTGGGVPVSVTNDSITVAGQSAPVGSAQGRALLEQLNHGLAAEGCKMTVLSSTSNYPQGFLLARQPPVVGVAADGHLAASMEGGVLVVCNLPASLTSGLGNFSPQRVQVLMGFAFTSVGAMTDPGGFGFGDLGAGTGISTATGRAGPMSGTGVVTTPGLAVTATAPTNAAPTGPTTGAPVPPPAASPRQLAAPAFAIRHYGLTPAQRSGLFVGCLVTWMLLTGLVLRTVRGVTAG